MILPNEESKPPITHKEGRMVYKGQFIAFSIIEVNSHIPYIYPPTTHPEKRG
jgi:hypothetical protein